MNLINFHTHLGRTSSHFFDKLSAWAYQLEMAQWFQDAVRKFMTLFGYDIDYYDDLYEYGYHPVVNYGLPQVSVGWGSR